MIFPLWASIGSGLGLYVILVSVSYAAGVTRKEWKRQKREFLAQESARYQQKGGGKKVVIDFHQHQKRPARSVPSVCHQPPLFRPSAKKQTTDDERSWSSSSSYSASSQSSEESDRQQSEEEEAVISASPPSPPIVEEEEVVTVVTKIRKPGSVFTI